jgi:2,6-dihydroxypseudooxynicotine hydrolase
MSTTTTAEIAGMTADTLLARLKDPIRLRRFLGLGGRDEDLFAAYRRIETLDQWPVEFAAIAESYERAGDAIDEPAVKVANWLTATTYFHLASLGMFYDNDQRIELYRSVVRAYRKAAPLLPDPAEVVDYTFNDVPFSGYLRRPHGVGEAPVVILLRGQDAVREVELHTISDILLQRGLATFAIDIAGQGESRFHGMRMPDDLVESFGAAVNYLEAAPGIDAERLALLGQSFGGHLAPWIASEEKRVRACVSLGGFYAVLDMDRPPLVRHNFMLNMNGDAEFARQREPLFTLDGRIENLTCPFYAANGSQDRVVPPAQSVKLYERAVNSQARRLKLYEGLPHCAYYDNRTILFDLADWILEFLRPETQRSLDVEAA